MVGIAAMTLLMTVSNGFYVRFLVALLGEYPGCRTWDPVAQSDRPGRSPYPIRKKQNTRA